MLRQRLPRLLLVAVALALTVWAWQRSLALQPVSLPNGAKLAPVPCWFEIEVPRRIQCARLHTAQGYGEQFELPVVVVRRHWLRNADLQLLYLHGGPGGAMGFSDGGLDGWLEWFDTLEWPVDLVLYDPRGVGDSEPQFFCDEVYDGLADELSQPLSAQMSAQMYREQLLACRQRIGPARLSSASLNTPTHAADVRDLIDTLGGEWNLFGVSYGTRLALEVMRQSEQGLRTVVLDSLYPPQITMQGIWPTQAAAVMDIIVAACGEDPDCFAAVPNPRAKLRGLMRELAQRPLLLSLIDYNEAPYEVWLTPERFIGVLFQSLYEPNMTAEVLSLLREGLAPSSQALIDLSEAWLWSLTDRNFSEPVFVGTDCNDNTELDTQAYQAEIERALAHWPQLAAVARAHLAQDVCADWRDALASDAFRRPVQFHVPTLLLAGALDPVTPPQWARMAHAGGTQAQLYLNDQLGHAVLVSDTALAETVRSFLRAPQQWLKSSPGAPDPRAPIDQRRPMPVQEAG